MSRLRIPAEEIEVSEEVDLLVVGGGAAGTAAAVAGARQGLRTALIEEMPFLGGMTTGGCVGTFCGFYTQSSRAVSVVPLVGGLPLEIAETLLGRNHALGPIPYKDTAVLPYVPWGVKRLLEELARAEPGLRVRLHAKLTHALVEQGRDPGSRGADPRGAYGSARTRLRGRQRRRGALATGRCRDAAGDEIQYPSMMFTMQNVDVGAAIREPRRAAADPRGALRERRSSAQERKPDPDGTTGRDPGGALPTRVRRDAR